MSKDDTSRYIKINSISKEMRAWLLLAYKIGDKSPPSLFVCPPSYSILACFAHLIVVLTTIEVNMNMLDEKFGVPLFFSCDKAPVFLVFAYQVINP